MKLETAPQDVVLSGSFEQRDVAIGDVAFILDLFSDKIYSNKERAVIRELACNAHDSHVMAGTQDVPFKVHLPTTLEPWFSIRDFGTGLCDEDIANVYGAIGVSTKRDSNEVIGCFGVGSLSPYSLCDSFTVKSYFNGIVRTYQCMRDEKRQPKVIPIGVESTEEPNGLEVKLTVNGKVSEFEKEAEHVFRFWGGTLPEINNKGVIAACKEQRDSYVLTGDDFGLSPVYGSMVAVMGNIAYSIPDSLDEFDCDGYLTFELGELEFDTARESLSLTDKTKQAIKEKFDRVRSRIVETAIDKVEEKETVFERAKVAEALTFGQIGRFVANHMKKYVLPIPKESVAFWKARWRGCDYDKTKYVHTNASCSYYLHKDRMQSRIREYLKDMSGHTLYVFNDLAHAQECGIPVELLKDLEDLPKPSRKTYNRSNASKVKTFYFNEKVSKYATQGDYWQEAEIDIDSNEEIVYVEISRDKPVSRKENELLDGSCWSIRNSLETIREVGVKTPTIVGLKSAFLKTPNFRKGKFIHFADWARREFRKIAPSSYARYDNNSLEKVKGIYKFIDQDEVYSIINFADRVKKDSEIVSICKSLGIQSEMEEDNSLQEMIDAFNDKYPMLKVIDSWDIRFNTAEIIAQYISGKVKPLN